MRLDDTERTLPFTIVIDGNAVSAHPGETIAAAMLAAGIAALRTDGDRRPRGLLCNMGTCCECLVILAAPGGTRARVRACLVDAAPGQSIERIDTSQVGHD